MVFRRRKKRHIFQRLREMLWPSSGWSRSITYIGHRLRRLPGSPYSIAAGFACGAAVSFTPLLGAHLAVGMLIAWLIGANVIAAGIGTVVGNPWTFPLIWYWNYRLGALVLGMDAEAGAEAFSFNRLWDDPLHELGPILVPLTVGSIPSVIVSWIAFYLPLRGIVAGYQKRRRRRITRRARELTVAVEQAAEDTREPESG